MREVMKVVEINKDYVYLTTSRAGLCESCNMNGACSMLSNPDMTVKATNKQNISVNKDDYVVVEIPKVSVSKLSFIIYGLPLIVFLTILITAYNLKAGDLMSFILALFGLVISYFVLGFVDKNYIKDKYLPDILEKINYKLPENFNPIINQ